MWGGDIIFGRFWTIILNFLGCNVIQQGEGVAPHKKNDSTGGRVGFYRRLDYSRPSPTILTSVIQKATGMCHPEELRPLTVKECASVQQFPKDWKFAGSMNQKYKQIGNAVPVGLAEVFGRSILKSLE